MFPPLFRITAAHLRGMLLISLRMVFWGMALHSSNNASVSSWRVWGCCGWFWIRRPSKSHKCSIQFRSGLYASQSITWIPAASRNSLVSIAECAGTPSCINVKFCPIISGSPEPPEYSAQLSIPHGWIRGHFSGLKKFLPTPSPICLCKQLSPAQCKGECIPFHVARP